MQDDFTYLQHFQLQAQIFVFHYLIDGIVLDEDDPLLVAALGFGLPVEEEKATAQKQEQEAARVDQTVKKQEKQVALIEKQKQAAELKSLSNHYEHNQNVCILAISKLEEKVKKLKEEHSQLKEDYSQLFSCAASFFEPTKIISVFQMQATQCEEFKEKYFEQQKKTKRLFNELQEAKATQREEFKGKYSEKQKKTKRLFNELQEAKGRSI